MAVLSWRWAVVVRDLTRCTPNRARLEMRSGRQSRFLLCLLILVLNITIQLFLSLLFGFVALPLPNGSNQPTVNGECSCPQSKKQVEEIAEPVTCAVPPSQDSQTIKKSPRVDDTRYLLSVMILSSVGGRERRDAIRETWMDGYKNLKYPVLIKSLEEIYCMYNVMSWTNNNKHDIV